MSTAEFNDKKVNGCGQSCAQNVWSWDVTQVTKPVTVAPDKYGVLLLNRPLTQSITFIKRIWNNAVIRVAVDGGAKHYEEFVQKFPKDIRENIKQPDLLTGDFDSIAKETLEKYKKKGCKVIYTPDQDQTDFTKALIELNIESNRIGIELDRIIVFSQCSGRMDHMLGNIQTLFLAKTKRLIDPNIKLYLLTDNGISWLLCSGEHYINIPKESRERKRTWCSLVPVGEPCQHVTTTGLKWNLDDQPMKFGELVSTSNTFDGSEVVTVNCSSTLLFSMKIPSVMDE